MTLTRRMIRIGASALWILLICAPLTGCVSHRMYRPLGEGNPKTVSIPDTPLDYKLAFVEFDDQGEMWDPHQLESALKLIRSEQEAAEGRVITTVFIHGWKNDASAHNEKKGNLAQFKQVLAQVTLDENGRGNTFPSRIADTKPRRVVGVFVSWRGKCMYSPGLDLFSFFTRRAAAQRVGSISMQDALFRLMHTAKRHPAAKCVVVGYSFGGAILEKAVAQSMVPLVVYAGESGVRIPADLIVVANPASQAIWAKQVVEIFARSGARLVFTKKDGTVKEVDGPLLASITSTADWVTRGAFAFGMYINNLNSRFRAYADPRLPRQRTLATHTAGHTEALHSHTVTLRPDGQIYLAPKEGALNHTPYWIMSVPGTIVPSHNQIFGPKFVDLLIQLMNRNMIFSPDVELRMVADRDLNFSDTWQPPVKRSEE